MDKCSECNEGLSDEEQRSGYKSCNECARGYIPSGSRYNPYPTDE